MVAPAGVFAGIEVTLSVTCAWVSDVRKSKRKRWIFMIVFVLLSYKISVTMIIF
jgi:hypothetical protein